MNELISSPVAGIRRHFLTTVCAAALLASVCDANASDDRPTVWIELGAQFEHLTGIGDPIDPPFASQIVQDGFNSPLALQQAISQSVGGEGRVSFRPEASDWVFSAAVRYGRANGNKATHDQTNATVHHAHIGSNPPGTITFPNDVKFSDAHTNNGETHAILDFQVGKDLGLGMFNTSQSLLSFGVRFAQFTSKQNVNLKADPDRYFPSSGLQPKYHHTYAVFSHMQRTFRGFGPSISWNASAPVMAGSEGEGLTIDWGVDAAVLFGRQKVFGHHQTLGTFYKTTPKYHHVTPIQRSSDPNRSKNAVVPDVGGFAGGSFRFSNAKVSLGYRADFFFGAMDGGVDTHRATTQGFYGPFATVSVGFGG